MQRDREVRENSRTAGRQFDSFGSLFGSDKSSSNSPGNTQPTSKPKGPVIEELDSDAEVAPVDEENDVGSAAWTNRNPLVEHPEDQGNDRGKNASKTSKIGDVPSTTNQNKVEAIKPQSHSVSFQRVTYGGINGAYYTATTSRRAGDDGVTLEERKQADRTTGQAAHRVSRGIHDKGISVTRKLDSDGKARNRWLMLCCMADELEGFEQAWGGIADSHFQGWNDTLDFPRISGSGSGRLGPLAALPDPYRELSHANGSRSFNRNLQEQEFLPAEDPKRLSR